MLKGKTAVITGASRGIGKAIALAFAQNHADIAVVYARDGAAATAVCAQAAGYGVTARAYACDVADYAATQAVCKQISADFSRVDILVNNAGITKDNLALMMSEADFDRVIAVNLKGAFNFIRHLAKPLIKSPAGRIVNISSVSGLMGNAGQTNYAAAKAGLIGLTKSIAKELAARRITCNAIAPGFIATDMTEQLPPAVMEQAVAATPLRRLGQAEEVAALAVFLASEQAAYITGEVIRVDGGLYI